MIGQEITQSGNSQDAAGFCLSRIKVRLLGSLMNLSSALPTFIITLREGFELVVGIVLACLQNRVDRNLTHGCIVVLVRE